MSESESRNLEGQNGSSSVNLSHSDEANKATVTSTHRRFAKALIKALHEIGYFGDLWLDVALALWRTRSVAKYLYIRRADILIPKIGLVIEIDGLVHENLSQCRIQDAAADYDWEDNFGMWCMRFKNEQLEASEGLSRAVNQVLEAIKKYEGQYSIPKDGEEKSKIGYGYRRLKIHRQLESYKTTHSASWKKRIERPHQQVELRGYGHKAERFRGGILFRLTYKRTKNSLKR